MWRDMSKEKLLWKLRDGRQFLFENMLGSFSIFLGFFILLLNIVPTGSNDLLLLGLFMLGMFFLYKQMWFFSLAASLMASLGIYYRLLISNYFSSGEEASVFLFIGLGFLAHYALLRKWKAIWPLIPGITMVLFGILTLFKEDLARSVFTTYWPITLIVIGVVLVFFPKQIFDKVAQLRFKKNT
ncbi:hypothetical protein PRVXH_002551 [Proteinivorax hydrogeniformans]|uniref:DUF5668 domain-containing protein n=1 Tax=Proteinivorax hydrogeniformans TaxID=1826727 RepID=A0AAU8HSR2_9FIRM